MPEEELSSPSQPQPAPVADGAAEVLVRVEGMAKAFGATQALRDARSSCAPARCTRSSARTARGKSTLVKILSGVHAPDAGTIELDGEPRLRRRGTPRAAQQRGIVTVFQEVLVAEARSVLDNVWLGTDDARAHARPAREKRARAGEMLERAARPRRSTSTCPSRSSR